MISNVCRISAPSAPQHQKFHGQLATSWHPLPNKLASAEEAEHHLAHLTQRAFETAPESKT